MKGYGAISPNNVGWMEKERPVCGAMDAILIKEGDNFFSVVSNDKALYYGTIYVTEEYIEVTDSGDLGLDGVYTLNYLYIS